MSQFVQVDLAERVATVRICRPDVHNAFNEQVIAELSAAISRVGSDDAVRAVVLASEGKSFSAGADLAWMRKMVHYTFDENVTDAMALASMLRGIRDCPKPVIARVHGAAFGGGVGLVAACDIAVAVSSATFCLSEVNLGIAPAVISPFLIERIGPAAARRYAMTAQRFDASEALRIGLISEVVESPDALDETIKKITDAIKQCGPAALAATKRTLERAWQLDMDAALPVMAEQIARLRASDEGQEGITAFLEKRKPSWIT